jgi:Na+-transporting methylmalonyl-CoA/oxaloacetate decarboxylase gamma subunit
MRAQSSNMGVLIFIIMAVVGIGLIIYSFASPDGKPPEKNPTPTIVYPTKGPTYQPTIVIATVAVGGDEPPPLPPG